MPIVAELGRLLRRHAWKLIALVSAFVLSGAVIFLLHSFLQAYGLYDEIVRLLQRYPTTSQVATFFTFITGVAFVHWWAWRRTWTWRLLLGGETLVVVLVAALIAALWAETPSRAELRHLAAQQTYATRLFDRQGRPLASLYAQEADDGAYVPQSGYHVPADSLPSSFIGDLKAIEGWTDYGPAPLSLVRALVQKELIGEQEGGASTITMQTYRLLTGHTEDTETRKLAEVVGAVKMSLAFSESEILELYINNSRWADEGTHDGLGYASRRLFSVAPAQLDRNQARVLLSCLAAPNRSQQLRADSVGRGLRVAYQQRSDLLRQRGRLQTGGEAGSPDSNVQTASAAPIDSLPAPNRSRVDSTYHGAFQDRVRDEVEWILEPTEWSLADGLRVETTLDRTANLAAGEAMGEPEALPAGARGTFLILNNESEILVYTTNHKSLRTGADLLASENTMPSSRFKAIVYTLLAEQLLAEGYSRQEILDLQLPTVYRVSEDFVVDDGLEAHSISLREALIRSKNAPIYYVVNELLSPLQIKRFAERLQIPGIKAVAAVGMGSMGVSELNLTAAYDALFLRNGYYRRPSFIRRITTKDGTVIYDAATHPRRQKERKVASDAATSLIKQVLREAVYKEHGTSDLLLKTAPSLRMLDVTSKTGTSPNKSAYRYRGLTGTVSGYTFSTTAQGEYLGGSAPSMAVPLAAHVLGRLQKDGFFQ